jgi:hypothetical protein
MKRTPGTKNISDDEAEMFARDRAERHRVEMEQAKRPLIFITAERQRKAGEATGIIIKRFGDQDVPARDNQKEDPTAAEIADLKNEIAEIEQLLRMNDEKT